MSAPLITVTFRSSDPRGRWYWTVWWRDGYKTSGWTRTRLGGWWAAFGEVGRS